MDDIPKRRMDLWCDVYAASVACGNIHRAHTEKADAAVEAFDHRFLGAPSSAAEAYEHDLETK